MALPAVPPLVEPGLCRLRRPPGGGDGGLVQSLSGPGEDPIRLRGSLSDRAQMTFPIRISPVLAVVTSPPRSRTLFSSPSRRQRPSRGSHPLRTPIHSCPKGRPARGPYSRCRAPLGHLQQVLHRIAIFNVHQSTAPISEPVSSPLVIRSTGRKGGQVLLFRCVLAEHLWPQEIGTRGRFPGVEDAVWEVCIKSPSLKTLAFSRCTATHAPPSSLPVEAHRLQVLSESVEVTHADGTLALDGDGEQAPCRG